MPFDIEKRNGKHCVIKRSDGKSMGCHDTRREAVRQIAAIEASEGGKSISIYKGVDGNRHMLIVTSNAYQDREDEFVSADALKGYVESQWADDQWQGDNTLLFWHDGPPIGDIVHADMEGPFLFEVARERKSGLPFIQHYTKAIWDYVQNNPSEKWGASHGFGFLEGDKEQTDDGSVYHSIRKFETSIVPVEYAANAYTVSGVIDMTKRDEKAEQIVGTGVLDKLRGFLRGQTEELDNAGRQRKSLGPQVTKQDLIDVATLAIANAVEKSVDDEEINMKDLVSEALDDLMEVPTVNLETAEEILAVEDDEQEPTEDAKHDHTEQEPSELEKALVSLVEFNEQLVTDQKALVEAMPNLTAFLTGIKALEKVAGDIETLRGEVAEMQENFKQRPRASQAESTKAPENDEHAKEITKGDAKKLAFGYEAKN